ncbi:MAG: hypothetical protein IH784_00270 [Bacteroidetes bacterium]|nr:hypothetical protein [Bacteroidota bacterium]
MPVFSKLYCALTFLILSNLIIPQNNEGPFKKLYDNHGLIVSFIFYSEGDGEKNNGVVIYLENKNDYNISFQFTLIFRAGAIDRVRTIDGIMIPSEKRTGSNDELYFIPFEDGRSLSAVGIKNCKVRRN